VVEHSEQFGLVDVQTPILRFIFVNPIWQEERGQADGAVGIKTSLYVTRNPGSTSSVAHQRFGCAWRTPSRTPHVRFDRFCDQSAPK
jgi:hypothetical protein